MYVAWQEVPVKGRGGGGPLLDDPELRGLGYAPPWRGLRCEHHGAKRVEWTPFVVEDERRDGQLRQRLLFRLPSLRSCCAADELHRAAWWHDVDWAFRAWSELGEGAFAATLARERNDLIAAIRALIPRPTPAGLRDFAAFRDGREDEDRARDEANRAFWDRQVREVGPGPTSNSGSRAKAGRDEPAPDFLAVLGLKPGATLGQVKARHRELVKRHHPDRGGEAARFRAVQDAYERAVADLARRAAE